MQFRLRLVSGSGSEENEGDVVSGGLGGMCIIFDFPNGMESLVQ
jgi:hypothetical protein